MIVTDLKIAKLDPADPRYPEPNPARPFTDVYLLSVTGADGSELESAFFVTEPMTMEDTMRHHSIPNMLRVFAADLAATEKREAA